MKEIDAEVKIKEMRRLNIGREDKGEIVWVRMKGEKDKKMIWEKKRNLKGRKI